MEITRTETKKVKRKTDEKSVDQQSSDP